MIRILIGMIVVLVAACASLGGLLWHERAQLGQQACEITVAASANKDTQITANAQRQADLTHIQQLQTQITQLQADANAAAHLRRALQTKLAKQTEVLNHVHDTDIQARRCLDASVPASLLDSLHAAAGGTADQTGQSG